MPTPPPRRPYRWNIGRETAQRLPNYLHQKEVTRILKAASESPRDHALLGACYHYGLRPGEVGLLRLSDLDLINETLHITRLKKGKAAKYSLFPDLLPILLRYLRDCKPEAGGPLFPSRQKVKGHVVGISNRRVHQIVLHYAEKAKIQREAGFVRGHCLRHSIATHLLDSGWDLIDVRDHLGQRSVHSTEVYAQLSTIRQQERFAQLKRTGNLAKL